ncbi:gustatory receptor for sugar taste 64f-like [Hyposmocoma kahamanoa]|uniref:gustatory receptor for sugar taste 64f-like n=1 Tax=Hyposmocoma kahamanoa TaxID=1477025 RepID=UPI000E6D7F69|nr:gustatory receptor for sugar taste 64f-like [Hyposmocoma kahamanoa]
MLGSERCWEAMVSFCEIVISQKEAAARSIEDDPLSDPLRRFGFKLKVHVDCPNYPSGPFGGYEHAVYFIYSSSFLIARVILTTLFASSVHTASLNIGPELYEVPSSAGNEINRFIEQVHGETVALTGYRFFNMTRGIVLSIAGTIVTYELVLMQFNG